MNPADRGGRTAVADANARTSWWIRGLILAAVLLGAWLRTTWLNGQLVAEDEMHSIAALRETLGYTLTHFKVPDNCIPISAWCKILSLSVGLDEWGLRFWSYLPGILLVILAVRASAALLSAPERLILAFLLACSPLLIFWSRTGRPYSAISLLGLLAVLALVRFGERRTFRWCAAGALCVFGLFLFSPTTVPAIAGLSLAAAAWGFQRGEPGRPARERLRSAFGMWKPSILAVLIALVVLAPALPSLLEMLGTERRHEVRASWKTWVQFAQELYGFPSSSSPRDQLLLLVPVGLTLLGLLRLFRARRELALPACLLLCTSPALYGLSRFQGLSYAAVFVRYQAATVPFYLFFLVYGVGGLLLALRRLSPRLAHAGLATALLLLAALTLLGPLRGLGPEKPFGLLYSQLREPWPFEESALTSHIPNFYRQLGGIENLVLRECYADLRLDREIATYQQLHGGRVIRYHGTVAPQEGQLVFKTLRIGREAVLQELPRGSYVVLHVNPSREWDFVKNGRPPAGSKPGGGSPDKRLDQFSVRECREFFGEPVYEDEYLVAYGPRLEGSPTFFQPTRQSGAEESVLSAEPLVFSATPKVVAPGEIVTFETTRGVPGEFLVLGTVERNGHPVQVEVATGLALAGGVWRRSLRIPPTAREMTLSFELTGDRHDAARAAENRVQVTISEP